MQMHKKTKKILSFQKFIFLQISCISFLLYLLFEIWEEEENTDKTSKRLRGKGWDIGRPRGIWLDFLRHLRRNFLYITVDSNLIHFYLKFWIKSIVLTKGELQICTIETGLISYYTFKIRLFQNPFSEPFFRAHEFTKQFIMLTRTVFLESTESFLKKDVKS